MHEMSIALEIARIAEEKLGDAASELVGVAVDVGDNAGVEPSSLEFCLEAVFKTPPFAGAQPHLRGQSSHGRQRRNPASAGGLPNR